ncbi:MAG: hypothetical protein M0Q40_09960 [Limnochordia bacterium]|nr:hypothetical protein [Limnochordia bacterium]
MKKLALVASLVLCLMLASLPAFAAKDADIDWGTDEWGGYWGFTYTKAPGTEEGQLQPYFHFRADQSRFNKKVDGAYVEGGQNLTTLFGWKLGFAYSPYVAQVDGDSRVYGLRIYTYKWNDWAFDGTYVIGYEAPDNYWKGDLIEGPSRQDVLLGAKGKLGDVDLSGALVRFEVGDKFYYNYSLIADAKPMTDMTVKFTYAGYQVNKDWLYNVDGNWKYMPGKLEFRAGFRNSEIMNVESAAVRGPGFVGGDDDKKAYVNKDGRNAINAIYNRDQSVNLGATTWFGLGPVDNKLTVDYDTTNPAKRNDVDDVIKVGLESKYEGFVFNQWGTVIVPDEKTTDRHSVINDPTVNRYDYGLTVTTPKYELGYGFTATGRLDFDWDMNYDTENRYHTIAGLIVSGKQDIWKLKNVALDAKVAVDMPKEKTIIEDPVKFAGRAMYQAPNGIKFRAEYYSSVDYAEGGPGGAAEWVHGQKLHQRYGAYRFYEDSNSPVGLRVVVGVPF